MTYKMSDFQSIDPGHVEKLRDVGIENTDDMMRAWADRQERPALAEKCGIEMGQLTDVASMSRLARMPNVGPKFVGVLVAAGIDGPKSLLENTPDGLVKRLGDVAAERQISSPVPTLEDVGRWFRNRKPESDVAKPH